MTKWLFDMPHLKRLYIFLSVTYIYINIYIYCYSLSLFLYNHQINVSASYIELIRGARLLRYEGYTYWSNNRTNTGVKQERWYCSSRSNLGCKAALLCFGTTVLEVFDEHNHNPPLLIASSNGKYVKMKC